MIHNLLAQRKLTPAKISHEDMASGIIVEPTEALQVQISLVTSSEVGALRWLSHMLHGSVAHRPDRLSLLYSL